MKRAFLKILSLTLALMMICGTAAVAESAAELSDKVHLLEVKLGAKVYSFAGTVEEIQAQGIHFASDTIKPGYSYKADNGRQSFKVLVDAEDRDTATAENTFVCGYELTAENNGSAVIYGGIVVGEATRADLHAAWGEPGYTNGRDYENFKFMRDCVSIRVYYVSDAPDAQIKSVEARSDIILEYGMEVSKLAGIEDENLPDPTSFSFYQFILDGKFYDSRNLKVADLTDKGWRLSARDARQMLKPTGGGFLISGAIVYLFNGISTVQAFVYNAASDGDEIPLGECNILYIGANRGDNVSLIVADGLTIGSTFDEVKATFGTNYNEEPHEDKGYTFYEYTMNDTRNGFSVGSDNTVIYIRVQP